VYIKSDLSRKFRNGGEGGYM